MNAKNEAYNFIDDEKDTVQWLQASLDILKAKSSQHKLQDQHYWFICPAETIQLILIPSIEKAIRDLNIRR